MLATDVIESIEEVDNDSLRYDITVLDNHNFFADGILVHNCQNIFYTDEIQSRLSQGWVIEEKLDGSSMTVGYRKGDFILDKEGQPIPEEMVVCSRNLSLKLDDDSNSFVRVAKESGVLDALKQLGRNLGISGELCGEGIQGNRYNIKGQKWFVFDILDVDTGKYLSVTERLGVLAELVQLGAVVETTPNFGIRTLEGETVDSLLALAEAKSVLNSKAEREGLVLKSVDDPDISFKAISTKYLLETKS